MPAKPKIGRPRLQKGHAKAKIVPVRVNAELDKRISAAAKASGQTVSHWIRCTLEAATNG